MRCAIFGNPVSHSLSPVIHALFAKQFDLKIYYEKICVVENKFHIAVKNFRTQQGWGANVTAPFKQDAFRFVDQRTSRAKIAGAVNTLVWKNNICIGDNTDGIGFIRDLKKQFGEIKNKNILILGAGGAAQGILNNIILEKPRKIFLTNRTQKNKNKLMSQFKIEPCSFDETKIDLIINATSADFPSLKNLLSSIDLNNTFGYDLNYGQRHEAFLKLGLSCCNGLGMLIEQAAESFYVWRNVRPNTQPIFDYFSPCHPREGGDGTVETKMTTKL